MLNDYYKNKLRRYAKEKRHLTVCPYCGEFVRDSSDAEYIKRGKNEFFYHRTCLYRVYPEKTLHE